MRTIDELERELSKARGARDALNQRIRHLANRVKWAKKRAGLYYPSPARALRLLIESGKRFTTRDVVKLGCASSGSTGGVIAKFIESGRIVRVARATYEPPRRVA